MLKVLNYQNKKSLNLIKYYWEMILWEPIILTFFYFFIYFLLLYLNIIK